LVLRDHQGLLDRRDLKDLLVSQDQKDPQDPLGHRGFKDPLE
jgi:hypothetical protein